MLGSPTTGNAIAYGANIVVGTQVNTANSITFSGTVANGGTILASGYVSITSVNTVNSISGANTLTLSSNIFVSGTIPLSGASGGTVSIAGNIPIANSIAYAPNSLIGSNVFVSGLLTVTSSVGLVGGITLSGNVVFNANVPVIGSNVGSEAVILIPPNIIQASGSAATAGGLASLATGTTPQVIYNLNGKTYYGIGSGSSVIYNQQNGQPTTTFSLSSSSPVGQGGGLVGFFTYNIASINVPANTASQGAFSFNIVNSTAGVAATPLFQLNYSAAGTRNNVTYQSSTGTSINAKAGFISERGSKVASITPTTLTFNLAKNVDTLQMVVGPVNGTITTVGTTVGPYGVGQTTNIPNVTIAQVNQTCSVTGTGSGCSVGGLSNLTGTPNVNAATTFVKLDTSATPLVVLDNAASAQTLIVVGSKYVNTVAQQIFSQNPSLDSSFNTGSVVVQAFGSDRILVAGYYANQTVQAGNQFIDALLSSPV
jgi:hypothetical protein